MASNGVQETACSSRDGQVSFRAARVNQQRENEICKGCRTIKVPIFRFVKVIHKRPRAVPLAPLFSYIQAFIRHNCTNWAYNNRHLQGLASDVWVITAVFYPLHGQGLHPQQFITLFDGIGTADRQIKQMFASKFGAILPRGGWGQCWRSYIQRVGTSENPVIPSLTSPAQAGRL